jgi:hypothetical protein
MRAILQVMLLPVISPPGCPDNNLSPATGTPVIVPDTNLSTSSVSSFVTNPVYTQVPQDIATNKYDSPVQLVIDYPQRKYSTDSRCFQASWYELFP